MCKEVGFMIGAKRAEATRQGAAPARNRGSCNGDGLSGGLFAAVRHDGEYQLPLDAVSPGVVGNLQSRH